VKKMNNLFLANMMRVRKNKLYWSLCGVMACISLCVIIKLFTSNSKQNIDNGLFMFVIPMGIATALFISIFFGTEYNDGTIRNKLIVGHKRWQIYLVNLGTSIFCALGFLVAYMMPVLLIGFPCLGIPVMDGIVYLKMVMTSVATMISFCALYTMVSMIYHSKAGATVINLLLAFLLLFACLMLISVLSAPETIPSFGIGGETTYVPNPSYVTGIKRILYQTIVDILPMGQSISFLMGPVSALWQLSTYSILVCLICTTVGIVLFSRKNIK